MIAHHVDCDMQSASCNYSVFLYVCSIFSCIHFSLQNIDLGSSPQFPFLEIEVRVSDKMVIFTWRAAIFRQIWRNNSDRHGERPSISNKMRDKRQTNKSNQKEKVCSLVIECNCINKCDNYRQLFVLVERLIWVNVSSWHNHRGWLMDHLNGTKWLLVDRWNDSMFWISIELNTEIVEDYWKWRENRKYQRKVSTEWKVSFFYIIMSQNENTITYFSAFACDPVTINDYFDCCCCVSSPLKRSNDTLSN